VCLGLGQGSFRLLVRYILRVRRVCVSSSRETTSQTAWKPTK
jgi:hypothetical protein